MHLAAAASSAAEQFVRFAAAEEIAGPFWHTRYMLEKYAPELVPAYLAAGQEDGRIEPLAEALDRLYTPVAYASLAALAVLLAWCWRRRAREPAELLAVVLLGLLLNAAICGVFSTPVGRYQSRLIWLASLAVAVATLELRAMPAGLLGRVPPPRSSLPLSR